MADPVTPTGEKRKRVGFAVRVGLAVIYADHIDKGHDIAYWLDRDDRSVTECRGCNVVYYPCVAVSR